MPRFLGILVFILSTYLLSASSAFANAEVSDFDPGVLCLPAKTYHLNTNCNSSGPAAYRSELAAQGIILPIQPLPSHSPDFELTYVPYRYGEVRTANAPVYGSIEDALKANKKNAVRRIDSSFTYISYTEEAVIDGKRFYQVAPGQWMTANDVSRVGAVPLFQGLEFSRTPSNAFGWVLGYFHSGPLETKRTPGYENDDYTGHPLFHQDIVQVFAEKEVTGQTWYLVGPDEWVPQQLIARVIPATSPPDGITGGRWIEVNLFEQTLAVYDNYQLVFATLIASGMDPFWTRPGLFQIYDKLETTPMRGAFEADRSDAYYLEDVPWTMYFDQARALHGAYWRANLGFPQSHGCVNLTVGDSRWIFDWAQLGDWVYVWDPSGQTPDDSSLYGAGGA